MNLINRLTQALRHVLSRLPFAAPVRLPTDPVPAAWAEIVAHRVPLVARLPSADQDRVYRVMQLFLREVPIEGCAGLEVTEEIRVIIAAQACLLLMRMRHPKYTKVRGVLVYPSAFVPKTVALPVTGQIVRPDEPVLGQAWQSGMVVLGWDAVERSTITATDGDNVVLHEFAHILDAEDGRFDGTPVLDSASAYRAWAALLSAKFAEHVARAEKGEPTTLSPYGAKNRAEFFAVATEAFLERPIELRTNQPALYSLLVEFFKLDPAILLSPSDATGAA